MPATRLFRRVLSLLLSAALLFTSLPAQAAMSVRMEFSDPSTTVPVGTEITVWVKGTNAAVVGLMVVPPNSREQKLEGDTHVVTFDRPGMYVLVGYCADRPDESDPGILRDMTPFHIVTVVGDAPAEEEPTELRGTLSLEAFTKPEWVALKNAELRWNELLMWVHLNNQSIPEGARLQVDLYLGQEHQTILDCDVGQDTSWRIEATNTAKALMAGGSGEPEYGRYRLSAAASIYTPDGQKITSADSFVMGWYSPEMLYVNDFFDDNWKYGGSFMGERLVKWLDMSERKEGNRSSSGYLMLEQEMLHREGLLIKAGELYVIWAQKALQTIGSLGTNLIFSAISESTYERKFGEAGQKALPYYNMLASVYNSYAQTLIEDVQKLARGAYIAEEIANNTQVIPVGQNLEHVKAAGDNVDVVKNVADVASGGSDSYQDLLYIFQPLNADSSYYILKSANRNSGVVRDYNLEKIASLPYPDGSGHRLNLSYMQDGALVHNDLTHFGDAALAGDTIRINTSKVAGNKAAAYNFNDTLYNGLRSTYGPALAPKADADGNVSVLLPQETFVTFTDNNGKRKIVLEGKTQDLSEKLVQDNALDGLLSAEDNEYLSLLKERSNAHKSDKWGKVKDAAGKLQKTAEVVGLALDVYNLYATSRYQSQLQAAYFNTYMLVSGEYIHMLNTWYDELEGSDVKDAEYIRAAIKALMQDIHDSCDESLTEAAQDSIVFVQTVEQWCNVIYDSMQFICEIPAVKAALSKVSAALATKAVAATKSAINWVIQATTAGQGAATGAGAAAGTTAAGTTASKLSGVLSTVGMVTAVFNVGSIVYDFLFGAKIGTIEAFYDVYYTKQTLKETLDKTLKDYGSDPTHQRAVDIIESLYLMKELKLKGENLVISYYLTDMYKHFDLDGVKEQLVLMNEIVAMDSNYELNGASNIAQVYVLHENYIAGTRKTLKDQGHDIDGAGFIIGGDNEQILGTRIVGMYCNPGETVSFQGVELEPVPAGLKAVASKDSNRDSASHPDVPNEADWLKGEAGVIPDWQNDMPVTLENNYMYVKIMYLYSNHGLDLLLTDEERRKYAAGETKVEQLLANNNDATGDELHFWQIKEKAEWQAQQRIVWTYVTRKYIESLPMFNRTTSK